MRRFTLLFSFFVLAISVYAVPALPGQWKVLTLADGTQVRAELKGDEFGHYWKAVDGNCYIESAQEGIFQLCDSKRIAEKAQAKRAVRKQVVRRKTSFGGRNNFVGKKKGLLILAQFKNKEFEEEHTLDLYKDIANKVGFTSDLGFKGSVKDYFLDQSNNKFEIDFDVVGPLPLPENYGYYGAPNGDSNDTYPGLMAATACQLADEYVDFKDYDWDGDGEVEQVFIIYAGLGQAAGGDANTIWPHEWHLQYSDYGSKLSLDGVTIDTYACGAELTTVGHITGGCGIEGIGTICHEYTHCLGIPDMYDTDGENYGMANWDLMCSGSYNGDSFSPAGYTSYERMCCGWLDPIVLNDDTVITGMKALGDGGEAYIIYNDAHRDEYYLLENRQQKGWDEGLAGSGLLVIHVDYVEELWAYNLVNNTTSYNGYNEQQRCTIIPADGDFGNHDIGTDVYPSNGNNKLTDRSTPRAYLYNKNTDGRLYMTKPITDITHTDGLISFVFKNQLKNKVPTAITTLDMKKSSSNNIYDLNGRYVGTDINNLQKGIYIINGKKVVK